MFMISHGMYYILKAKEMKGGQNGLVMAISVYFIEEVCFGGVKRLLSIVDVDRNTEQNIYTLVLKGKKVENRICINVTTRQKCLN